MLKELPVQGWGCGEKDLAKDTGNVLQPRDGQSAQGHGDRLIILWEGVGRGGKGQCEELLSNGSFWTTNMIT